MKPSLRIALILLLSLLVIGCSLINFRGLNLITPSDTIVTESRQVAGFTAINMTTFGRLIVTQGDQESLSIEGSDNLVPLVKTTVNDGVLTIDMDATVNISKLDQDKSFTFTITVIDLTLLDISGLGEVEMEDLSTSQLKLDMSGAGSVKLGNLDTEKLDVSLSGLGGVDVAGQADQVIVEISGAGTLNAGDLQCQTAEVSIPGLGSANLWVTDTLRGEISGGGSVSYYGNPETEIETSGLGEFKSLGDK